MLMVMIYCITVVALSVATPISSSESREVSGRVERSAAPTAPTTPQACYLKYFAGGTEPTGLEFNNPTSSLRYLCHTIPASPAGDYFSTLFDDTAGIAIFSAYTIDAVQGVNIGKFKRPVVSWKTYPGLSKQGSDALYAGHGTGPLGIDKGHLNPSLINSYNDNYMKATFTYANAVPQYGSSSNRASWKSFEGKIAKYVKETCAKNGGTMYLLTGTSKYRLQVGVSPPTQAQAPIQYFPAPGGIVRPNSLWTAGCCVTPTGTQSIAVMGNNDPSKGVAATTSMDLKSLEKLLVDSKMAAANLFPSSPGCRTNTVILK